MASRREKKLQELKRRQRQRAARQRAGQPEEVVVGFFGLRGANVLCDGDACVITRTREAFQQAHQQLAKHGSRQPNIRPTTFAEIWRGLQMGAAYALDPAAYEVFRPLAEAAGWPVAEANAAPPAGQGLHLVRVRHVAAESQAAPPQWLDDEGVHTLLPAGLLDPSRLDDLTRRYQENIRRSPLWDEMVREFGPERAEELLRECRAELR